VIYSLYGTSSTGCQGGDEEGWFREDGLSEPLRKVAHWYFCEPHMQGRYNIAFANHRARPWDFAILLEVAARAAVGIASHKAVKPIFGSCRNITFSSSCRLASINIGY
jgi:hypothetical protein